MELSLEERHAEGKATKGNFRITEARVLPQRKRSCLSCGLVVGMACPGTGTVCVGCCPHHPLDTRYFSFFTSF